MSEWYPKRKIGMLPAEAARRWGDRPALVYRDLRWTYAQLDTEVDRVAKGLIAAGIGFGEHVGLWIPNRPEFLLLYFAIIKIGAVAVPFNTRFRTLDLDYALRQSDCAALFMVDRSGPVDYAAMAREVLGETEACADGTLRSAGFPRLRRIGTLSQASEIPGSLPWEAMLARADAVSDVELAERAQKVDPDGLAMIMYTSGTTGYPKGAMFSHKIIRRASDRLAAMGLTRFDVQLNYLPLFHMYSLGHIVLHSVLSGASQILMETFDPLVALRLIESERVTTLFGFDTHYRELIQARKLDPSIDISSLRVGLLTAGLDNTLPIAIEAQELLCPTISAFGSTETGSGFTQTFLDGTADQRTYASGYPLPDVEVRIVDPETGRDAAPGEQGEILMRAYGIMLGYYNKPNETAETIDRDGWLHMGDAGIMLPDGHIRFNGRYKDMFKVGGENVSAAEVESVLMQIAGIEQVAVVAAPDPRLQEVAAAFVVPAPEAVITLEVIDNFCRGRIASFKIPRKLVVVDQFPMTPSGKVQKHILRSRLGS